MPYPGFHKNRNDDMREDIPKKKQIVVDTAGHTENFFTNHVKLITFLVCIAIFLALFGPFSVFRIKEWVQAKQNEEVLLTEADVARLVDKGGALRWSDFDGYTGKQVGQVGYTYKYDVQGGKSFLYVSSAAKGGALESVLLVNVATGEQRELLIFE